MSNSGQFKSEHTPWNKNKKGKQKNHNTEGLKLGRGWNKGKKLNYEVWNKGKKLSQLKGDKNPSWKGDDVGYFALHDWIYGELGYPNKCEHCGLISDNHKKIHWANRNHKYKRNLNDWLRLCISCHRKYDIKMNFIPKRVSPDTEFKKKVV